MEPSPLTQVSQQSFQPKIIHLYETLFREEDEDVELSEGFWEEFFLHRPDHAGFKRVLGRIPPDEMLHLQEHSQALFRRAIARIKAGSAPSDEIALETLTVFLDAALSKKYTNPSSDIISVLAGLHDADAVMAEFVGALDMVIRNGRNIPLRLKAVRTTLSITAAGFLTVLPSYFTHRDLFPSLMKYIQDGGDHNQALPAFYLLGLLVNYNKFEFQNPYRLRLDDFVNDAIIQKIVVSFGETCVTLRDAYVAVQDDMPEGWSLGSTLNYFSLGLLAPASRPATPTPSAEESKSLFATLPGPEIGVLLSTYDFANANKVFCFTLVSAEPANKGDTSPMSAFLSLTSYLFQHAHRSQRAALYTYLSLFVLQILVEDQSLVKRLCSEESKLSVRLCRQRQPYLPLVRGDRTAASVIIDLIIDGINHNLRRKLDINFYTLSLGILLRLLTYLSRAKVRISYHWSELWRSLLSFFRFLTTYVSDIRALHRSTEMVNALTSLLAFALSSGENFLPDPAAYDDLFYKLVETGDILTKFRDAFDLSSSSSMQTLVNVSGHYHALLEGKGASGGGSGKKNLSPKEVSSVIKQGYETLSIEAGEGLERWERYREAEWKGVLKRVARVVVEDAKALKDER
ncbi:hypothetical protein DPSP01_004425 [Paraphaeosphaeria sporulosa]|uniref:DUF1741-domain-containing protein n=1 Tax=Paraphaeosphaeria sporulosa TaxID=1460663 RepID=A0A177CJC0_9PLEO|nr:DUF1741-domain-containing protein [Paraphaeosphaeria sporulosa]OAG07072.1 DUF1741-domain-containing protein [Paraphaeosphaeria sporulosa]